MVVPLYCMTDVLLITLRPSIRASVVRISSVTPSEKNSFSALALMLVKGRTAIEAGGVAFSPAAEGPTFGETASAVTA